MVLEDLDSTAIKAPEGSVDGGGGGCSEGPEVPLSSEQ